MKQERTGENLKRRSGGKIMARLILLLGNLSYVMILAVINGSLGFILAMGVSVLGALGIAKVLGVSIAMSYELIIGLTIGSGVLRGVLRYFEQYSNHYIAFRLLAVLRDKIFSALRVLAPAKLESKQKGSIIALITSDIETIEVFYAHTISPISIAILVSVFVIVFSGVYVGWYLALVEFVSYITLGIIYPVCFSKKIKEHGVKYRKEFAGFNAYFLDSIKGIKDIVLNNSEESRRKQVNIKSETLLNETSRMKKINSFSYANVELLVSLFVLVSLSVGIFLVLKGVLEVGKMIVGFTLMYAGFGPVLAVSALPGNLTQTFASGDRLLNLLEEEPKVKEIKDGLSFSQGDIEIKDVCFSYDGNKEVLKGADIKIKKGEIIGIKGESGSGKSTLLKLMLRFWDKDKGFIKYGNNDVNTINTKSLSDNVTLVSQDTYLFDESIEDNLKIAKPDASEDEIVEACKYASIHDFITNLPEGYKTRVGFSGCNLSAGEKQRIGLARAFLKGSDYILLDEPTSNVDSINEGIILKDLKEQKNKKTIVLVSHRESTMAIADTTYVMKDGKTIKE